MCRNPSHHLAGPVLSDLHECGAESEARVLGKVKRAVFDGVHVVRGLRGGGPDARKPPLRLVSVCGVLDIQTGPNIFGDRHSMVKNVRTVWFEHLEVTW